MEIKCKMPKNSEKANHARRMNGSYVKTVQEMWASQVLNIPRNIHSGPDLLGEKIYGDVKFLCRKSQRSRAWTTQNHQVAYKQRYPNKEGFWFLGFFDLSIPFQELKTTDYSEIEKLITERELYITTWNWMDQFPPHHCKGETHFSKWEHDLRYAKIKCLPKITKTYKINKGLVHLTIKVPEIFIINSDPIIIPQLTDEIKEEF